MRSRQVLHEVRPLALHVGGGGERAHVAQHLAQGPGVQREHLGLGREPFRNGAHVVHGHRAHGAQRLGHDQVRLKLLELLLVELVERLAAVGALTHGTVDLAGAEPLGDHAAREVREPLDALRVVALVGDGH